METVANNRGVASQEVGYEDVACAAFGVRGKAFISACMYTELYGICAILFIIMVRLYLTCSGQFVGH